MFENNYKNAMDNIKTDKDTREKILGKIASKEEDKPQKNPATPWRVAFACVMCIAIVLGAIFVPKDMFKAKKTATPQTLSVAKSYEEIYNVIKPKVSLGKKAKKAIKKKVVVESLDEEAVLYESTTVVGGSGADDGSTNGAASDATNSSTDKDYSTTTEQVEGVAEADIVKTDGEYIYYLSGNQLSIFKAEGENSVLVSKSTLESEKHDAYCDMFLNGDRLVLMQPNYYTGDSNFVSVFIYDVTNPGSPQKVAVSRQEGWYNSSRMVGDYIYLISECSFNLYNAEKDKPETYVPVIETNGVCETVPADSIYRYEQESYESNYTVIGAFNCKDGSLSDTANLLGGTDNVYCSQGNIILAKSVIANADDMEKDVTEFSQSNTTVSRLSIAKGQIEYKSTGSVDGVLDNQFYIDEHNGYFRFVTTVTMVTKSEKSFDNSDEVYIIEESVFDNTSARLTVLDSELKKVGEIADLAKGERVYSVRFMGDTAYFVTFRQTDPLFSADLSDPQNPKILGELKIPGFSEYLYPYGDGLLLGFGMDADEQTGRTEDLKLSMFDITDPANVTEEDVTQINGYAYSPALSNHKAMLVHVGKNIIGFATTNDYRNAKYMIYEYTGDRFNRKATLDINCDYWNAMEDVRGLFIEEDFYVISSKSLQVFDMNSFNQIAQFEF